MKIFYSAYTCQGNIGDLLINKYQIEEYSKYADVYVFFTNRKFLANRRFYYGNDTLRKRSKILKINKVFSKTY